MENQELDSFVRGIIDDKKLAVSSEEVKQQLVQDMTQRLLDVINRELIDVLSEDKVDELNQLLDRDASEAELQEFFTTSVPDSKEVVAKAMVRFRNEYLA